MSMQRSHRLTLGRASKPLSANYTMLNRPDGMHSSAERVLNRRRSYLGRLRAWPTQRLLWLLEPDGKNASAWKASPRVRRTNCAPLDDMLRNWHLQFALKRRPNS